MFRRSLFRPAAYHWQFLFFCFVATNTNPWGPCCGCVACVPRDVTPEEGDPVLGVLRCEGGCIFAPRNMLRHGDDGRRGRAVQGCAMYTFFHKHNAVHLQQMAMRRESTWRASTAPQASAASRFCVVRRVPCCVTLTNQDILVRGWLEGSLVQCRDRMQRRLTN